MKVRVSSLPRITVLQVRGARPCFCAAMRHIGHIGQGTARMPNRPARSGNRGTNVLLPSKQAIRSALHPRRDFIQYGQQLGNECFRVLAHRKMTEIRHDLHPRAFDVRSRLRGIGRAA